MAVAWRQSRYDKGETEEERTAYLNCPMTATSTSLRRRAARRRQDRVPRGRDRRPYFDGCLPIEVMAERGRETLRFGPMKPVGLTNAHTPQKKPLRRRPAPPRQRAWDALQHRGFQTKMKHGAQVEVFRLSRACRTPLSRGSAASTATPSSTLPGCSTGGCGCGRTRLRFAGQITGVEGYVESAAMGFSPAGSRRRSGWAADGRRPRPPWARWSPHHRRRGR